MSLHFIFRCSQERSTPFRVANGGAIASGDLQHTLDYVLSGTCSRFLFVVVARGLEGEVSSAQLVRGITARLVSPNSVDSPRDEALEFDVEILVERREESFDLGIPQYGRGIARRVLEDTIYIYARMPLVVVGDDAAMLHTDLLEVESFDSGKME